MPSVLNQYITTRKQTELLCEPLIIEDYIPQPEEFVSPPKWHIAHVTWFFEEMILKNFVKNYKIYHPNFSFLFNSYYNTIGDRTIRIQRGVITRPNVSEVFEYRAYVDQHMLELLKTTLPEEVLELVIVGVNHEQQHQELLITDLKYTFSLNPIMPVYDKGKQLVNNVNSESGWIDIKEGIYQIGYSGSDFSFDNELGVHKVFAQNYSISKSLVTNGEFIEFIESGGYSNFEHWLDEGWSWVNANGIRSPLYWQKLNNEWHYYTLAGLELVDPLAILCHVSFFEANAYATWCKLRLPTEFEWEIAADQFNWGKRWEWTNSAYLPYPDFKIAEGAVGEYNGKFMVNQMVLKGASVVTSKGHSRKTYRNFFHPKYQWQYSGIRLAK